LAVDAFDSMKQFMEAVSFKKATLIYLASKLPEKYLDELRKAFILIDTNGDGRIERKEFKIALDKSGHSYTEVEVSQLINTLDINKNGYIDYTEFLAGCMKSKIYLKDEHLRRAFEYFDKVMLDFIGLGQKRDNNL
jgi:calcium-dependent protein kinase